jgi:orotate phosphoribosyltransferase-like protein
MSPGTKERQPLDDVISSTVKAVKAVKTVKTVTEKASLCVIVIFVKSSHELYIKVSSKSDYQFNPVYSHLIT